MSCDNTKFVISRGSDNTFTFTIKQDNSTLPLVIVSGTDTFTATLINLSDEVAKDLVEDLVEGSVIDPIYVYVNKKPLVIENASIGKVKLLLSKEHAEDLVVSKGSPADRFYLRPTYKLILDCVTQNNGNFIAKVAEVYVD